MISDTQRLSFRPWDEADASECYKYAKDPRVGPAAGWPVHTSVENSRQIIKEILSAPETYAIILKETGLPVGSIGLMFHNAVAKNDDEAELGYWLGAPYWGKGIMTEAANEILRYAFEELKLERVWCGYFDKNERSKRVQEKLGFKYIRTENNIDILQIKEKRSVHINCITRSEWLTNNKVK